MSQPIPISSVARPRGRVRSQRPNREMRPGRRRLWRWSSTTNWRGAGTGTPPGSSRAGRARSRDSTMPCRIGRARRARQGGRVHHLPGSARMWQDIAAEPSPGTPRLLRCSVRYGGAAGSGRRGFAAEPRLPPPGAGEPARQGGFPCTMVMTGLADTKRRVSSITGLSRLAGNSTVGLSGREREGEDRCRKRKCSPTNALIEKGAVTITLEGKCEIPIPSMAEWAKSMAAVDPP